MPHDSTYMRYLKIIRSIGTESGMVVARVWAGGKWGVAVQL